MRVGILGGTFDPPHIGHLILGEYAADALDLTHLLYVPAAEPPHKRDEAKTDVKHRLAMLRLALADNPRFEISQVDIERPGPHYSVDTVRIIARQYPDSDVYFIMGGDSLRDLTLWHRPDELIRLCKLAVMRRAGADAYPSMHEDSIPGLAERVTMIDAPLIQVSSTHIMERIQDGRSIRYLTPDSVRTYIEQNHLYQESVR